VHALGQIDAGHGHVSVAGGALHIESALGEVKLDIHKVTHGLAHDGQGAASGHSNASQQTVWSTGEIVPGNGVSKSYSQGNNGSGGAAAGAAAAAGGAANAGASGAGNRLGPGNGNAFGLGNGNAFGLGNGNGIGNAFGLGHGVGNPHGHPPI
jgi:hypothetical protein